MCLEYQEKLEVQEAIQRQVVYGPRLERSVRVCTQLLHSRSGEDEENSDVANEHYVQSMLYVLRVRGIPTQNPGTPCYMSDTPLQWG